VFGEEIDFEQHCRVVGVGMGSVWPRIGEWDRVLGKYGFGAVTGLVRRRFFYRLPVVKRKTAGKGLDVGFSDFYFGS
jgi:hypothetical protein